MPLNKNRLIDITSEFLSELDRDVLQYEQNKKYKPPTSPLLNRYFSQAALELGGLFKGIPTKAGKPLQTVLCNLANDVPGQQASLSEGDIDVSLNRESGIEWFNRVCNANGLVLPPSNTSSSRTYLVQIKTQTTSESGSSRQGTRDKLAKKAECMRKEDSKRDIVLVYYTIFGTAVSCKPGSTGPRRHYTCYELSGAVGFDWLVGDPDGKLFELFSHLLSTSVIPLNAELETMHKDKGYFG